MVIKVKDRQRQPHKLTQTHTPAPDFSDEPA